MTVIDAHQHVWGPSRARYDWLGSDWPVSVLAGGYDLVWDGLVSPFRELDSSKRAAVLGGTATDFYRIDSARLDRARKETP